MNWGRHVVQTGAHFQSLDEEPDPAQHRDRVEPWLSALFQAEHLNLVVGSGLTTAVARTAGAEPVDMRTTDFRSSHADAVMGAAEENATRLGRGEPNFEDQTRSVLELIGGLRVLAHGRDAENAEDGLCQAASSLLTEWESELDEVLSEFVEDILATEQGIHTVLTDASNRSSARIRRLLGGFLLPLGSRAPSRERAHVFTLNYDRLIEYGCDLLGLRIIDRFVGTISPVFHSSRLGVDLHYNPPGIRGEPRYLEGVVRLTKLHGSIDWRCAAGPSGGVEVQRSELPFGAPDNHPGIPSKPSEQLLIYPNATKDVETLEFPYAELFRDFATAACQPNAVVVTYGYGFGDDHVNRVLRDMLSIPSTHLVIISFTDADGRIPAFCENAGYDAQVTLLVGPHFGDLGTLVEHYLPKPAIDRTTWRMVELLNRRSRPVDSDRASPPQAAADDED